MVNVTRNVNIWSKWYSTPHYNDTSSRRSCLEISPLSRDPTLLMTPRYPGELLLPPPRFPASSSSSCSFTWLPSLSRWSSYAFAALGTAHSLSSFYLYALNINRLFGPSAPIAAGQSCQVTLCLQPWQYK